MARYPEVWWPRPSRPRPAEGGIRASSRRGSFAESWWGRRWIEVLEGFPIGARLGRGRSYARKGQVLDVAFEPGVVTARVQGSRVSPYALEIELDPVSPEELDRMAGALAERPRMAARLLAGEMPAEVEEVCREAGVPLFPESEDDLRTHCSCPDWSNPCKHIAAVYYLVAEELDRNPFLLFKLRGFGPEHLLGAAEGTGAEERVGEEKEGAEPLPTEPHSFWATRRSEAYERQGTAPLDGARAVHVHALGRVPFWRGDLDPQAELEAMIDRASALALELLAGGESGGE